MTITTTFVRRLPRAMALCAVAVVTLGLGACADTELNGKIFDVLGVSSAAQAAAQTEPKMAERTGLVLPPDASRLPEPGSGGADDGSTALTQVDDPERRKAAAAAERERLHKAYCSGEMGWKERAADKDYVPKSPYGPCGFVGQALKQQ